MQGKDWRIGYVCRPNIKVLSKIIVIVSFFFFFVLFLDFCASTSVVSVIFLELMRRLCAYENARFFLLHLMNYLLNFTKY